MIAFVHTYAGLLCTLGVGFLTAATILWQTGKESNKITIQLSDLQREIRFIKKDIKSLKKDMKFAKKELKIVSFLDF